MIKYIIVHTFCGRQCSNKKNKQNFIALNYISGIKLNALYIVTNLILEVTL